MILCVRLPRDAEPALPALLGLIEDISPVVQVLPPGSALVDVRGAERYFGLDAAGIAAVLRVRALAHLGTGCVIGVAATPMLARMAADEAAPGTTFVVPDDERAVERFLAPGPVGALPGIGTATARTLRSYGLDTIGAAAAVPLSTLQRIIGVRLGREVYEKAHGIDRTPVVPNAAARSIAAERTFPLDELHQERQRRALLSITEELGVGMRGAGQVCGALTLTVRYADRSTTVRTRALREPTAHSAALAGAVYRIHGSLGLQRARVRALSVRAEGLIPAGRAARQLTFDPADDRARRIEAVADLVRAKFGAGVLLPGSLAA
ncbi:DNA polymerase thumb domain-containing protein [Streptomyces sp. NPDC087420]|uniref:DNA polymerase Y family protein n=1 Tax=Streptomyces sp. NPDC087420 TaxID=3365785 RepID=UPI0038391436